MNRRAFLSMLAGAVLDPERLVWTPKRYVPGCQPMVAAFDMFHRPVVWKKLISIEEFERLYPVSVLPIGWRLSDKIWTTVPPMQSTRSAIVTRAAPAPMGRVLLETTYLL